MSTATRQIRLSSAGQTADRDADQQVFALARFQTPARPRELGEKDTIPSEADDCGSRFRRSGHVPSCRHVVVTSRPIRRTLT
jgi:hypothetical protein